MVPVDLRRVLGKREPHAVGHPPTGQELNGLLRASGPVDAHQHLSTGSGAEPGLVQCPADDLDMVGGSIRAGVTGPQHERRALTGPLAGSVVEPCGQGVVAEPLLEGRGRPPLCLKWTPTRVASMSITNGRSALIPAVGECSPARSHTRCLTVLRARPRRPRQPRRGRPGPLQVARPSGQRQQARRPPSRAAAAKGPTGTDLPGPRTPPDPP